MWADARARHVCVVTETYPPEINGVALTLARLVGGLGARGHLVSLVRPSRDAGDRVDGEGTLVRGVRLPGAGPVRIGLPAGRTLRDRWTACRPDVAYVATEGPLGWSAVSTAGRLGIPVFSGFHTDFRGYAPHYGAGWLQPVIFDYLRRFHNRTLGTLVASDALQRQLHAGGFRNLTVLGRGVDSRLFSPGRRSRALRASWGATDADLVALYVGRLAPEKNLALAVEAYRAMQAVNPSVRFVVVGAGPSGPALQRAHPDLRFCGIQTDEALAAHYASADVFLFPSETETFGNVTLEAMASGLVVVAFDYAAARLHVTHGETGLLVPCGQPRAFVAEARAVATAAWPLDALRRGARSHALAIDWDGVVDRFEAFLSGAVGARHAFIGGGES